MKRLILYLLIAAFPLFVFCISFRITNTQTSDLIYYMDGMNGSDINPGTLDKPLKTISELNKRLAVKPGSICFASDQRYIGTIILKNISASGSERIKIYSTGNKPAMIDGKSSEGIRIINCKFITISNLNLVGDGRKTGNRTNGITVVRSSDCMIEHINVSGFQKSGIDLYNCTRSEVAKVNAVDNGFSGINVMGSAQDSSRTIVIRDCKAENNPGDPTILDNHSGNGILVGVSDSVSIDHCSATNNGWDMPRQGNGPVGIWAWESNHVTIQYCISYRNKTSRNAKDGGGFDLDGGVKNSVIQYCLSYENQGAGYGLFQYYGASDWKNNIIRYCISIDDGQITEGSGGIFIWNGSDDIKQLKGCMIYNNVVFNTKAPLISYESSSKHSDFTFCNNIFISRSEFPIGGKNSGSRFVGNIWWNTSGNMKFMNCSDLTEWAGKTGQEILNGKVVGIQQDPGLYGPFITEITDPYLSGKLTGYVLKKDSPIRGKGLDIKALFGVDQPEKDFFGNRISSENAINPGVYGYSK